MARLQLLSPACASLALGAAASFGQCPPTLYVDQSAPPGGDGESWATAYSDLTSALDRARSCASAVEQVWVAEGIYSPDAADPLVSFDIVNGVDLFGGFPEGGGEFDRRNPGQWRTILSGDLGGGTRSKHILTANLIVEPTIIDGFTIRNGFDEFGAGGALLASAASLTITDCRFIENRALWGGAVWAGDGGELRLLDCVFSMNEVSSLDHDGSGGAVYAEGCPLEFTNCAFNDNSVFSRDFGYGGAIHAAEAPVAITGSTFNRNHVFGDCDGFGGAVYVIDGDLTASDCVFNLNRSTGGGCLQSARGEGGAVFVERGRVELSDCDFVSNESFGQSASLGAGVCAHDTDATTIDSCLFTLNATPAEDFVLSAGAGVYVEHGGAVAVRNSAFIDNESTVTESASAAGGAAFLSADEIEVRNSEFIGNRALLLDFDGEGQGGALFLSATIQAIVKRCAFEENRTTSNYGLFPGGGGAIRFTGDGAAVIANSRFSSNSSDNEGGAIAADSGVSVINSVIFDNSAGVRGGALWGGADARMINCTIASNVAGEYGGGAALERGVIANSILWRNAPDQIFTEAPSAVDCRFSDIDGGWSGPGEANTVVTPQFVDPMNGDYRVQPGSRVIDAGDSRLVPAEFTTDIDGRPRFVDDPAMSDLGAGGPPIVDLGAHEFQDNSAGRMFCAFITPRPLIAGGSAEFDVLHGVPEMPAHLIYTLRGRGELYVPELNVQVDLADPRRVAPRIANAEGAARWRLEIPVSFAGQVLSVQFIQRERKTDVMELPVK